MATIAPRREAAPTGLGREPLQSLAVLVAGLIAFIYGLLYLGVLSIEGAEDAERGILGVAAMVFVLVGGLLWFRRSRLLWASAAALQLLMGGMYLAIAPDRDPPFELWGLTIRLLSLLLLVALIGLLVTGSGRRTGDSS